MDLSYDYWAPAMDVADGAPVRVLILMHGRGASRQDLAPLRSRLPRGWHVVLPDAPHGAPQWGYGPGFAWYRFLGDDRTEKSSLEASLSFLDDLVREIPAITGGSPTRVVMGGFSQGGTMSHAYALTRPRVLAGVMNFSGFLPSGMPLRADSFEATRFFWGHGTQDQNIPFALAEKGRAALRSVGADLETRDYAIGHWIDPDELRDASTWLDPL